MKGEILELKNTINTMVDQLRSFAAEVTRVAREVGTEGKLGGQADVKGVAGTWKDLTDNVNFMAGNLTAQVRNIAAVTKAVANGDLSKKITVDVRGEILELKDTINTMVDQLRSFASEVTRVAREVGTEGKLGGQADVRDVAGTWKDLTDSVNFMAGNLTGQVRNIAEVTKAVASGDLSKKITVDVKGEILELKNTVNTMVDQLSSFAAEVTRVAREVGTEGKLGGQAEVKGVSGTWKDLTDNVNFMAGNLTSQVRGIASVVTAVANGDLKQKLTVEAKGEIAALADTINGMIDTLATFADQVTTVAREVGVEGKLGGQASVPGAAGTWKDLTDNVNQLAANLTTQVRAIAEVATAVTKGDLTRSIKVEAQGEVAALKDNINEMIVNLKDTTLKNAEQDWLKTNLAKFSRMLQGQKDLLTVGRLILSELAPVVSAQHAVFYTLRRARSETPQPDAAGQLRVRASERSRQAARARARGSSASVRWRSRRSCSTNVPPDYIRISSGLGGAAPVNIIVLPVVFEGQVKAVLELASFERFNPTHQAFLDQLTEIDRHRAQHDRSQHADGRPAQAVAVAGPGAAEPAGRIAADQRGAAGKGPPAGPPERRSGTQESGSRAGPPGAGRKGRAAGPDLEVQVRVPGEHVARAAHAAQQLADSVRSALEEPRRQSDAEADRIRQDDPLVRQRPADADQRHSRPVEDRIGHGRARCRRAAVRRSARLRRTHVPARGRGARASTSSSSSIRSCRGRCTTDSKRLQQIIKNLLSNAFKFTHHGRVSPARARSAYDGWNPDNDVLNASDGGAGVLGDRHRHRHSGRQAADHLRGVPAGRRQHEPQVRRHGPGPGDQPRNRPPARRRNSAGQHAGRGQHVHAVPAADVRAAEDGAARRGVARSQHGSRIERAADRHRRRSSRCVESTTRCR